MKRPTGSGCVHCGFMPGKRRINRKSKIDRIAYALYVECNRGIAPCCGEREEGCSCWTGWRREAKAAIKEMRSKP